MKRIYEEISELCHEYQTAPVTEEGRVTLVGDHVGGLLGRQFFRDLNVRYELSPWVKSECYLVLEQVMRLGRLELLDDPVTVGFAETRPDV
jgi:hypothetical protein